MKSIPIEIQPTVAVWARKATGMEARVAAKKIGISEEALSQIEAGTKPPSIAQLRKMAAAYKRPLAVMLLPEPPKDFDALHDFRSRTSGTMSPELAAEIRRAQSQREVLLDLGETATAALPSTKSQDPEVLAGLLRTYLDVRPSDRNPGQGNALLGFWLKRVEDKGVLVVQTKGVEVSEARGFSVSDWPVPVIALNGSDYPRGRAFTLLHELAHLLLREQGLCDASLESTNETEKLCNRIAAAALMPKAAVEAVVPQSVSGLTVEELNLIRDRLGGSVVAVLLRLMDLDKANWTDYQRLKPRLDDEYAEYKKTNQASKGGPTFYTVKARDLGHAYIRTVLDRFSSDAISSLDVSSFLDVRYDQVPKLAAEVRG